MKIPNSTIRYAVSDQGPDYLFLHLLEPHSNGEDYTDSILEVVNYFGVKRYCRLGAMYDAVPHTRPLLVTGSLGSVEQKRPVPNFKLQQSTYQGPTHDHEPAVRRDRTGGYRDPSTSWCTCPNMSSWKRTTPGTSRMIEVLSSVYENIPQDLAPIRRGQRQYRELNATVDRNSELKTLIQQMEAYYDAQLDSEESSSPKASPASTLSPEIERFLSDLGGQLESEGEE